MPKRILAVLSEFGYWGEEPLGPLQMFHAQGDQVDFVLPFVTGCSNHDSYMTGQKMVGVLEDRLTRYGW